MTGEGPVRVKLTREQINAQVAKREAAIEVQRAIVEKLSQLHDDEDRELSWLERGLADYRELATRVIACDEDGDL